MNSSTAPRCDPSFPTRGVLLDNSALVRLWKCEALEALGGSVPLHAAGHILKEFKAQGPAERAAIERLAPKPHRVGPSTPYWDAFATIRGGRPSTRDLGEDESLAVAVTAFGRGELFPFVTYDRGAADDAARLGVVTLDFLDTLAWLVHCGRLTAEQADAIEADARVEDGWRPPVGYTGSIETVQDARVAALVERVRARRAE